MLKTSQQVTLQDIAGSCFVPNLEFANIQIGAKAASDSNIVTNGFADPFTAEIIDSFSLSTTPSAGQLPNIVSQSKLLGTMSSAVTDVNSNNSSSTENSASPDVESKLNHCVDSVCEVACDKKPDCVSNDSVVEACQASSDKSMDFQLEANKDMCKSNLTATSGVSMISQPVDDLEDNEKICEVNDVTCSSRKTGVQLEKTFEKPHVDNKTISNPYPSDLVEQTLNDGGLKKKLDLATLNAETNAFEDSDIFVNHRDGLGQIEVTSKPPVVAENVDSCDMNDSASDSINSSLVVDEVELNKTKSSSLDKKLRSPSPDPDLDKTCEVAMMTEKTNIKASESNESRDSSSVSNGIVFTVEHNPSNNQEKNSENNDLIGSSVTMMDVDTTIINDCIAHIVDVTCQNDTNSDNLAENTTIAAISSTSNQMDALEDGKICDTTPTNNAATHFDKNGIQHAAASTTSQHATNNSAYVVRTVLNSVVETVVATLDDNEFDANRSEDTDDEQMRLANELLSNYLILQRSPGEDCVNGKDKGTSSSANFLSLGSKVKQEPATDDANACKRASSNNETELGLQDASDNAKARAFWDLGLIPSGLNKPTKEQIFSHKENGNDRHRSPETSLQLDKPRGCDHNYYTSTFAQNDSMWQWKQGNLLKEVRKAPRPFDEVYGETESARKGLKRKRLSHPNRGPVNVSEKCLEPFKLGWMRELVFRATLDEGKARNADVYYHNPAKEKLRSYREIEDFLKTSDSNLTIEHFSFAKFAIYHPPEEIVREAKRTGVKLTSSPKTPAPMPSLKLKIIKTKKKLKTKFKKESGGDSESFKKKIQKTYELVKLPQDGTSSPLRLRLKKNIKRTPLRGVVEVVPCSLNCPGQKGILPSLHCGVCLCLYHPPCVGCENSTSTFVCIKCISDRSTRLHGGHQHSKENEPASKDGYSSGDNASDPPLSLQVKAELILDEDSSSPTKEARPQISDSESSVSSPSTPVRSLPKLIQMPPSCVTTSPVSNTMRPPPPLQKAPGISLISKATGATWMPPSGLPPHTKLLQQQPPPLRLGNAISNIKPFIITNGISQAVPNRAPPPLIIRPMTSSPSTEHVPASIVSMFAVRPPTTTITVTSAPQNQMRLSNPIVSGGRITIVQPSQVVLPIPTQQPPTSLALPAGLLQRILTTVNQTTVATMTATTTTASVAPGLTVSKVTPPKVLLPAPINTNPKAVLVTMMNNTTSTAPSAAASTTNVNSMKFTLKTNSGTTTEVLVPQVKPPAGSGPLQPKYIVVNKQGQPTGLVVGVGNTVIQLPILNQSISVTDPSKLLKEAVTASVKPPGVQASVSTVTATSSAMTAPKPVMLSGATVPTTMTINVNSPQMLHKQTVPANQKPSFSTSVLHKISAVGAADLAKTSTVSPSTALAGLPTGIHAIADVDNRDVTKEQKSSVALPEKSSGTRTPAPKIAKQRRPGVNPSLCAMEKLMGGTKALLRIFRYLRQDDLSRASGVCRTWRWLASQTEKWKCIKLNGIQVCDWDRLVEIINRHESTRLDMRGMKTFEDKNRTWHGFAAALQDLSCIHRIDFGQVPVSILHTVANSLMQLQVLTAEWITDIGKEADCANSNCRLDVGKFGQLAHLEKLRLRGVRGIQLPTFTLSRGLSSLSSLSKLTHLSLTTLKDVPPNDFDFLNSLTQLTALEIGDCTQWQEEHYNYLTNLNNLKLLRLECSGLEAKQGLSEALLKLKQLQHLELYRAPVDQQVLDALKQLRLLTGLSLWPLEEQDGATVNTAIFVAVTQLLQLEQFVWGLATENYVLSASDGEKRPKKLGEDSDIIEIGSDEECEINEADSGTQNDVDCIPFLVTEAPSEDSDYLREYLGFKELDHRLRRKLIKTKISLHPLSAPITHSRVPVSK